MHRRYLYCLLVVVAATASSCTVGKNKAKPTAGIPAAPVPALATQPQAPLIPILTPAQEAKTFDIKDGYRLELVISDPIIKEPALTVFDGNGRMYVAEMRSYMQNIDGHGQNARTSRISLHWSSRHNGIYDKHTVFVDNLLLPRMILPLDDGVLVNETDSEDIWLYRDTKGTGVADKKELFYAGGPRGGNLEHQPSGLIWALDNWMYVSMDNYRLRIQPGHRVMREGTAANMGQWGLTQDDYGKPWFINAGYEVGPLNFEESTVYGAFNFAEQTEPDWPEVWPLVGLADYQGGPVRVRPADKTLNHFTSTCGDEIYRGDRLPADLHGDLLFCEPVGRLIRRTKIDVKEGFTRLKNAYDKTEFIRSTDPYFRPINIATAPDGTLYITDMYRGIIQESAWVNQGSYLRSVVQQYHLDENVGRGRIWRLVHKGYKPGPQPRMLDEKPAELVRHLEHPNGWWRDTAQKLLILRGDKSAVPALVGMARSNTNFLARVHAIWTLEGLDSLPPDFIREKLKDEHPQVRIAAIRAGETLYKNGDHSLVPDISALTADPDPNVVIQVMMTANLLQWPDSPNLIAATVASNPAFGVKKMGTQMAPAITAPATPAAPPPPPQFTDDEKKILVHGEEIYKQLCFACHGLDGRGTPLAGAQPGTTMAPPLSGSRTATGYRDGIISVVLKGLGGPVAGKTYDAQMIPMQSNDDDWIAAVSSYIRNNFGNHATFINAADVARVRAGLESRTNTWTLEELFNALPQPLTNRSEWKLTASNNSGQLGLAIDGNIQTRYDTRTPQTPGMWVQIELPEPQEVCGLELDSATSLHDYPVAYKVELSDDGQNWGPPVATGHGTGALTEIIFPSTRTKFIRITQTGLSVTYFWAIHELQILQPAHPAEVQIVRVDPIKTDAIQTDTVTTDAVPADLFIIDPLNVKPVATDPIITAPVTTDTVVATPVQTAPVITAPAPVEPVTNDLTPAELSIIDPNQIGRAGNDSATNSPAGNPP